jgi:hypothetical protein
VLIDNLARPLMVWMLAAGPYGVDQSKREAFFPNNSFKRRNTPADFAQTQLSR